MNVQDLLNDPPLLHEADGAPFSYQLANTVLGYIGEHVDERSKTLETGAGVSTVVFALKGADHTCINPDAAQVERIKDYCRRNAISTDRVNFQVCGSEKVLPRLELSGLDLVLIDGCHGFPAPFIDWYYAASALKAGGMVVLDDTHLWTGDVLKKFLLAEPDWRLEQDFPPRASAFVKLGEGDPLKEWCLQPYTVRHSKSPDDGGNGLSGKARRALRHALSGEFSTLARKFIRNTSGRAGRGEG